MSQCTKILGYMEKHGSITPAEAVKAFDCYRLAARISDLKARGVAIKTVEMRKRNDEGRTVRYARYYLEG